MLRLINKRFAIPFAWVLLIALIVEFIPQNVFAQQTQPEHQGAAGNGNSNMVDMFTGDFSYNIPLLDVDGYPITMGYKAGISPEQEASWVGLGWSLNPGSLNRYVRGFPDDFKGEEITSTVNLNPNTMSGTENSLGAEFSASFNIGDLIGAPSGGVENLLNISLGLGIEAKLGKYTDNYKGTINEIGASASNSVGLAALGAGVSSNENVATSFNTANGVNFTQGAGLGYSLGIGYVYGEGVGGSITTNSRIGTKSVDLYKYKTSGFAPIINLAGTTTNMVSIPVGSQAYMPATELTFLNQTYFTGKKTYLDWYCPNLSLYKGKTSITSLRNILSQTTPLKTYGYCYNDEALGLDGGAEPFQTDINRDKDGELRVEIDNLPFSYATYDVYVAQGAGNGIVFRPKRSDAGAIINSRNSNIGIIHGEGKTIGLDSYRNDKIHTFGISVSSTSDWTDLTNNPAKFMLSPVGKTAGAIREPYYFEEFTPMTGELSDLTGSLGGEDIFYHKNSLENFLYPFSHPALTSDVISGTVPSTLTSTVVSNSRKKRSTHIKAYTKEQSAYCHNKSMESYPKNVFAIDNNRNMDRSSGGSSLAKSSVLNVNGNQFAEFQVKDEQGATLVYGLPVYSKTEEHTFNASTLSPSATTNNLVTYSSTDDSPLNEKGKDHYFHKREIPKHANTFLLTANLSDDYVDVLNDGCTTDDIGDYTKFNYTCNGSAIDNYNSTVRTPRQSNTANINPAVFSANNDDRATYQVENATKWYLHSIESKNQVAVFETEDRLDAQGASGELAPQLLKRIKLYSKNDAALSVPIKTVEFEYDYSLCQGTPNSNATTTNGKLTLKAIHIYDGLSGRNIKSSYKFNYAGESGQAGINPSYHPNCTDRWGTYTGPRGNFMDATKENLYDYPYTKQPDYTDAAADRTTLDNESYAWCLTQITLPSGAEMKIEYEADDYRLVHTRNAGRMYKIVSTLDDQEAASALAGTFPSPFHSALYDNSGTFVVNIKHYDNLLIDLGNSMPQELLSSDYNIRNNFFKNIILNNLSQVYFKAGVVIAGNKSDIVTGYAEIDPDNCSLVNTGNSRYAILKFKPLNYVEPGDPDYTINKAVNPLTAAAWQFGRTYNWDLVYPNTGTDEADFLAMGKDAFKELKGINAKQNKKFIKENYGKNLSLDNSYVRMYNGNSVKVGGGHRVKAIRIKDNWNAMSGEKNSYYGTEYSYTEKDANGNVTLSHGVASYEPLLGGDENSNREPIKFIGTNKDAPDDLLYQEYPIAESVYPNALVGYEKVTVKNVGYPEVSGLPDLDNAVNKVGTSVYEFYTTNNFPYQIKVLPIEKRTTGKVLAGLLALADGKYKDYTLLSQAYVLKLNDMHGKPKSVFNFPPAETKLDEAHSLSGFKYSYKTNPDNPQDLSNTVDVVAPDNTIATKTVARDIDIMADYRSIENTNLDMTITVNSSFVPVAKMDFSTDISTKAEDIQFKTACISKIVNVSGVIDEIIAYDNFGATKSSTKNLLYDDETGEAIVTSSSKMGTNGRTVYTTKTPAYWAYNKMAGHYRNDNYTFPYHYYYSADMPLNYSNPNPFMDADGVIHSDYLTKLCEGDIIVRKRYKSDWSLGETETRLWVVKTKVSGNDTYKLIDENGTVAQPLSANDLPATPPAVHYMFDSYQIIKSGFKNNLSDDVQLISSLESPVITTAGVKSFDLNNTAFKSSIINAEAQSYSDYAKAYFTKVPPAMCSPDVLPGTFTDVYPVTDNTSGAYYTVNPYLKGFAGNYYTNASYKLNNSRDYSGTFDLKGIINPGVFKPFWVRNGTASLYVHNNELNTTPTGQPQNNGTLLYIPETRILQKDIWGNVCETVDALGRYQSFLYLYGQTLKQAEASNAKLSQIFYDSFEHYPDVTMGDDISSTGNISSNMFKPDFKYNFYQSQQNTVGNADGRYITDEIPAHTGRYSLKMGKTPIQFIKPVTTPANSESGFQAAGTTGSVLTVPFVHEGTTTSANYTLDDFSPAAGLSSQKYLLSYWINVPCNLTTAEKEKGIDCIRYDGYAQVKTIIAANCTTLVNTNPQAPTGDFEISRSEIVDGWQKVDILFTLTSNDAVAGSFFTIKLDGQASGQHVYLDDIRIQPYDASMTTYVYDNTTMKPVAVLDDKNFATKYVYDRQNNVVGMIKETAKYKMSVSETRTYLNKH